MLCGWERNSGRGEGGVVQWGEGAALSLDVVDNLLHRFLLVIDCVLFFLVRALEVAPSRRGGLVRYVL